MTNDIYNVTYNGTEVNVMTNDTSYVMTDLIQGTTYAVRVQVVTSLGSSRYTPNLILTTMQEKSEIEVLQETIEREIKEVDGGLRRSMKGMNSTLSDSIQAAKADLASTKTDLSLSIKTTKTELSRSIQTAKDALTTAIGEVKSDLQKRDANLTALITGLSNDIKAQRPLVEKYGVIFVGYGYYETSETDSGYSASSLSDCLSHWRENRPGKDWNGIYFYTDGNGCYICKNEKGHFPYKGSFHFKYVQ